MKVQKDTDFYKAKGSAGSDSPSVKAASKAKAISWSASEYIDHQRGAGWYGMLVLVTLAAAAVYLLVSKDLFGTVSIVILGVIVGFFVRQKPRRVTYELSDNGLKIGAKMYSFNLFKTFSVASDGALNSVNLQPLKRLMPPISAFFEAKDGQRIIALIGDHLPLEEDVSDGFDRLTRRLKI